MIRYFVDAFLKVKLEEISPGNLLLEGANYYLAINWKGVIIKVRKLCVAGNIEEIRSKGRFTDILLKSGDFLTIVRVWEEKGDVLERANITQGEPVKVMGILRVFQESPYIVPIVMRKISTKYLEHFQRRLTEERDMIVEYVRRLPEGEPLRI